jgi:hypothetical protein
MLRSRNIKIEWVQNMLFWEGLDVVGQEGDRSGEGRESQQFSVERGGDPPGVRGAQPIIRLSDLAAIDAA